MSEDAKKYRAAARTKIGRLLGGKEGDKVDASDYKVPGELKAEVKTGARPISKRLYKKGGRVKGEKACHNAGRSMRADGGALSNANIRKENEKREGEKHVGGFKKGGRARRGDGGVTGNDSAYERIQNNLGTGPKSSMPPSQKNYSGLSQSDRDQMNEAAANAASGHRRGGRTKRDLGGAAGAAAGVAPGQMTDPRIAAQGQYTGGLPSTEAVPVNRMQFSGHPSTMLKRGGKASGGGHWIEDAHMKKGALHEKLHVPEGKKIPAKKIEKAEHSSSPSERKEADIAATLKKMPHKAHGGKVPGNDEITGARPTGGRLAKADGGAAKGKKGAVNIIIAVGGHKPDAAVGPGGPPMAPPGGAPHPIVPPPSMPPPSMGGAGGPPTGGAPGGGAPMMPPQVPRKDGGKVGGIKSGAGGGEGRLEKIRAYGKGI